LTPTSDILLEDSPQEKRPALEWILDESFEGWYLRHAKKTLRESEVVRVAVAAGGPIGLAMLKRLDSRTGYVYYIAVARAQRRKGMAGALLDDALEHFRDEGVVDAYASVEGDNEPSLALFRSRGFTRTNFGAVSKKHGKIGALIMYKEMLVVPGEMLLHKVIDHVSAPRS
jgi:ribosomal protein S18 acetylase RimI-like enzyme